jgi:hypothetical protein
MYLQEPLDTSPPNKPATTSLKGMETEPRLIFTKKAIPKRSMSKVKGPRYVCWVFIIPNG